jgi:hypothetical protein
MSPYRSLLDLVKDKDILVVTALPEVVGYEEEELEEGWDSIASL